MTKFFKIVIFSIATTIAVTAYSATPEDSREEDYRMIETFGVMLDQLSKHYVEEKSKSELITAAIKGMLKSLDPHSTFMVGKEVEKFKESTTGKFGGLGIHIVPDTKTNTIKVVAPIDGTPAQQAGIESGDLIIEVDGTYIENLEYEEAVKRMRGEPDTDVTLKIFRENETPFDVTITRAIIKVPSVKSELKSNAIGYIKLVQFQQNMTKDLHAQVNKLQQDSETPLRGYIIDMRNNPGGLLTEAISVSDSFLTQGEIVSIRGRDANQNQRANATAGDITNGAPIVVLVNRGSASASEIVAGALRDHKRAIIVGERTFGKGSVQSTLPLSEDMEAKFTTALYYTPNGTSIQKVGIVPDIQASPVTIEKEFTRGDYGEGQLSKALDNAQSDKPDTTEEETTDKTTDKKTSEQSIDHADGSKKQTEQQKSLNQTDYMLARALDVLETLIWRENQAKAQ